MPGTRPGAGMESVLSTPQPHPYGRYDSGTCLASLHVLSTELGTAGRSIEDHWDPPSREDGNSNPGWEVNLEACWGQSHRRQEERWSRNGKGGVSGEIRGGLLVDGRGLGPHPSLPRAQWWLGLGEDPGWGCQKVALWVSPSSCGQVIPALQPER